MRILLLFVRRGGQDDMQTHANGELVGESVVLLARHLLARLLFFIREAALNVSLMYTICLIF